MAEVMVSGHHAEIVLEQQTFIRLLATAFPGPDDPEPSGPAGPISGPRPEPWRVALAGIFGRIEQVLLNPQPLPPKERAIVAARVVIADAIDTLRTAEAVAEDGGERALSVLDSRISKFVIEFCGTPPHPPRPWPHPWGDVLGGGDPIQPVEMLAASVQFQQAADADTSSPLHAPFSSAAEQMREAALKGLAHV
jgi:hypothetical protein